VPFQQAEIVFVLPNLEQNELASWLGEFLGVGERLFSEF
jgi:hypothetical protein